jgi:hypothetical protein
MLLAAVAAVLAVWEASRRRAAALVSAGAGPPETLEETTRERGATAPDPADTDVSAAKRFVSPPVAAGDLADAETEEVDGEIVDPHAEMTVPVQARPERERQRAGGGYGTRFRSIGWATVGAPPTPEAKELRVGFDLLAGVMELARVDVRETPSQVFVTVLARMTVEDGSGWSASAEAQEAQATVTLATPLGERELVHAPVDEPAPAPAERPEAPDGAGHHAPADGDL